MDHVPRLNSGMSGTVTVLIGFSKDPVALKHAGEVFGTSEYERSRAQIAPKKSLDSLLSTIPVQVKRASSVSPNK